MTEASETVHPDVIVVARSAIAAAPLAEMQALADALASSGVAAHATFAFTEQGEPALRDCLSERIAAGAQRIVLVPLLVPMEPSFANWIAKVLARWGLSEEALPDSETITAENYGSTPGAKK